MVATKSQGFTNAIRKKRVMLGIEAERVEMSSALTSRTGDRVSVVRDKLEVFMQERSSLRGMFPFSAGEPWVPERSRSVAVMHNTLFLHSPL